MAFRNVYDFLFSKMVVMEAGGEWYERVDRSGSPLDAVLGHAWKINYHSRALDGAEHRALEEITARLVAGVRLRSSHPGSATRTGATSGAGKWQCVGRR